MKKLGLALCALLIITLSYNRSADAQSASDLCKKAKARSTCESVCSDWSFGRATDDQVIKACGGKTTTKPNKTGKGRTKTRGTGRRNRKGKDPDKDGIVGKADKCPDKPETINGYKDDDGCPDEKPVLTIQQRIEMLEKRRQEDGKAIEDLKPSFAKRNVGWLIWVPTGVGLVVIIFFIIILYRQKINGEDIVRLTKMNQDAEYNLKMLRYNIPNLPAVPKPVHPDDIVSSGGGPPAP